MSQPVMRNYMPLLQRLRARGPRAQIMRHVVDGLWEEFSSHGISWVGFYIRDPQDPQQLLLDARRDKPACSPIGLHGACGRSFTSGRALVVTDVAKLGAGYIACDPRDKAEVVVPVFDPGGNCWGVLDVDSHEANAFDVSDALCLMRLLRHVGLSSHLSESPADIEVI